MRIFNISGGRTSAYMTIEHYKEGDMVIFCDTGREHKGTYEFLDNIEKFENIPIIRLKHELGFSGLIEKRKAIPNIFQRFCTVELKIKTTRRYLRSLNILEYESFIGFRYDEPQRYLKRKKHWKKVTDKFPLYDDKISKKDIISYWKRKEYDLNIPAILGNCDACFMKGENAILAIYKDFPELAQKWIDDEEKIGKTYLKGVSHKQMLEKSKLLMKQYNLFEIEPKFNCACTN
jgi:hypothetical protein